MKSLRSTGSGENSRPQTGRFPLDLNDPFGQLTAIAPPPAPVLPPPPPSSSGANKLDSLKSPSFDSANILSANNQQPQITNSQTLNTKIQRHHSYDQHPQANSPQISRIRNGPASKSFRTMSNVASGTSGAQSVDSTPNLGRKMGPGDTASLQRRPLPPQPHLGVTTLAGSPRIWKAKEPNQAAAGTGTQTKDDQTAVWALMKSADSGRFN